MVTCSHQQASESTLAAPGGTPPSAVPSAPETGNPASAAAAPPDATARNAWMPRWVSMRAAMAPRIAAASRLIGMRRGCSTTRRKTANAIMSSTMTLATSIVAHSARARLSPRRAASENDGNSPWIRVSPVPIVMMRKPQKMKKWYLLPMARTRRWARAEGMLAFSITFFCPKK